jgi:hypothetical protein
VRSDPDGGRANAEITLKHTSAAIPSGGHVADALPTKLRAPSGASRVDDVFIDPRLRR